MPSFDPGTIVKVPFPYTNRPTVQSRPALVLASIAEHAGPPLLWVAMVTSAAHRRWQGDVPIEDLDTAGLPSASVVRPSKIATIETRQATPIGRLAPAQFAAVHVWVVARFAIGQR